MKNVLTICILILGFSGYLSATAAYQGPTIVSLGKGVILEQSELSTLVKINKKIITTYGHQSDNIPFIWDEGCNALTKKLEAIKTTSSLTNEQKQDAWNSLGNAGQAQCLKEHYKFALHVEKTANPRFVVFTESFYEGFDSWIIDTRNGSALNIGMQEIVNFQIGKAGVYIQTASTLGDKSGGIILVTKKGSFITQFSAQDIGSESDFVNLLSFELLSGGKLKVQYERNNSVIEKIMSIKI